MKLRTRVAAVGGAAALATTLTAQPAHAVQMTIQVYGTQSIVFDDSCISPIRIQPGAYNFLNCSGRRARVEVGKCVRSYWGGRTVCNYQDHPDDRWFEFGWGINERFKKWNV